MAANLQRRGVASFGKRFVKGNWIGGSADPSPHLSAFKRTVHASVYDKNVDEQVRPAIVPDHVLEAQSDKYWGPNPQTGVFGPSEPTGASVSVGGRHRSSAQEALPANGSVLEQQAWFRTVEDVEKPPHDT